MAHRPLPEPRWRWWVGAAAEMALLFAFLILGVLLAGLQPPTP
jgi:hypothetical protein